MQSLGFSAFLFYDRSLVPGRPHDVRLLIRMRQTGRVVDLDSDYTNQAQGEGNEPDTADLPRRLASRCVARLALQCQLGILS